MMVHTLLEDFVLQSVHIRLQQKQIKKKFQKELSKSASESEKIAIKNKMKEISSLNKIPQFEFLRDAKFRIKTKRIFDHISQGICIYK